MRFGEFVFYKTDNLSLAEKAAMLIDCKKISYAWKADKLDCSISSSRQHYECSFEEIIGRLKEDFYVFVIDRGTWGDINLEDKEHFEVGFRSMEVPVDYFLFIEVESGKMPPIIEKYRLSPIGDGNKPS